MSIAMFRWRYVGLRCFVGALFVTFLSFRSTASSFWSEANRFFFHWQRTDILAIALLFAVVSFGLCVVWAIASSLGKKGRWVAETGFIAVLAFFLKVNIMEATASLATQPNWLNGVAKGVMIVIFVLAVILHQRLYSVAKGLAVIFSPIVAIYLVTLFTAKCYITNVPGTGGKHVAHKELHGIMLVIFDEWSYPRTFSHGRVETNEFPNIARATDRAVVFHETYSPATETFDSIPSILVGTNGQSHIERGIHRFRTRDGDFALGNSDNIFKWASQEGYHTVVIGNYMPYADSFGSIINECYVWDLYKVLGKNPAQVALSLGLENMRIRASQVAPFFAAAFNRAKNRYFSEMALNIQALIENEASNMNGKFVFVHHSVPHMPLIFDRNGFIGKPERTAPLTVKAYLGNLRYIDTLIGRFLDSNTCDDFVWILTSDHSFRFDPDNKGNESETSPTRHVPLLIHFPGQTARHDVNEVLFLKDLKPLLAELSQNGFNPTQTAILQKWVAEKKEARE